MSDAVDCYACNGTGIDSASWDGRCPFCMGRGEVDRGQDDDPDEDVLDGRYESWVQTWGEDTG